MEDHQPSLFTISLGRSIVSASDSLSRVSLRDVAALVADTRGNVARLVSNLRQVLSIDPRSYRDMKRALPYFVCAAFSPSFRRGENFAFADCFVVDVDHVGEAGLSVPDVRARLQADPRVALCFVSPGGDGLKVLFRLAERCYDKGVYSAFYKVFITKLAEKYGLGGAVDTRTSDVTRACFVSTDPQVYVNDQAQPVSLSDYVNADDAFALQDLMAGFRDKERKAPPAAPQSADPDSAALAVIKAKLADKAKVKVKPLAPPPYVPKELDELMPKLTDYVTQAYGIEVYEVLDIQYGKKVRARLGSTLAELNLFFGKRGFRPVISPRGGTSAELNQSLLEMAECFLADYPCRHSA